MNWIRRAAPFSAQLAATVAAVCNHGAFADASDTKKESGMAG